MSKKIMPSGKIREDVVRRYNKDPEGWGVFMGRDKENYISSIFVHKSDMWTIKEFAVNPYKFIGCGIRTRCGALKPENYSFGLRPLTMHEVEEFRNGNSSVMGDILNKNPVPDNECDDSLVLEGPIITSEKPLIISSKQEKLDSMLRKSLNSIMRRKYPGFMRSYL